MRMPRRPKKRCAKRGQNASTDPLVNPGDTAHCEPHGPASDPGNSNHRLVNLEKNPSSCGKDRAYATKNATVMLAKLDEIRDNIQFWDAGAQPAEWLAAGNVVMSSAYNARAARAAAEGRPVGFSWVNSHYSIDSWVIPAGSPQKELAMEFIAFANGAEPQTKFAELFSYGPANAAAVAAMPEDLAKRLPAGSNIESSFLSDEAFWTDNIDQITERWNVWVTR